MPKFLSFASTLVLSLVLALASGCRSSAPLAHTPSGDCHPACPGARTGELADASSILRGGGAPGADDMTPGQPVNAAAQPAPSTAAYVCPMHPWLGADAPGRCPECNMPLVARETERPRGE